MEDDEPIMQKGDQQQREEEKEKHAQTINKLKTKLN
jgi:hypothetical protein